MGQFQDYAIFSDESGTRERFLTYGAIYIPEDCRLAAEERLEQFCITNGFGARELSWKKCSKREVERYGHFASLLWQLNADEVPIDFRSLVLDTVSNPLKAPAFGCNTVEDGFYRFYHHFLTKSTEKVAGFWARRFTVYVADTEDSYQHRTEILVTTVNGALRKALAANFEKADIRRVVPKANRLHQLADVLAGAVSYRKNQAGRPSWKGHVAAVIEEHVGGSLEQDFGPEERPFNIWWFAARGKRRWAPGSRGWV
jgi:hypothetical protein